MFEAMGPDRKSECGIEKGGRVRENEHVLCSYRPSDGRFNRSLQHLR
jgi:hypothetical protein